MPAIHKEEKKEKLTVISRRVVLPAVSKAWAVSAAAGAVSLHAVNLFLGDDTVGQCLCEGRFSGLDVQRLDRIGIKAKVGSDFIEMLSIFQAALKICFRDAERIRHGGMHILAQESLTRHLTAVHPAAVLSAAWAAAKAGHTGDRVLGAGCAGNCQGSAGHDRYDC